MLSKKERKKEGETKTKMEGNENTIRRKSKRGKNTRKKLMKYSWQTKQEQQQWQEVSNNTNNILLTFNF